MAGVNNCFGNYQITQTKTKKIGKYTEDVNKLSNETDMMVINELGSQYLKEYSFLRTLEMFTNIKCILKLNAY